MKLLSLLAFLPTLGLAQNWTIIPEFPGTARDDGVCFRIGAEAYCGTGLEVGWMPTRDFYAFDPKAHTWRAISKMPAGEERQYAVAFSSKGYGFVYGGLRNGKFLKDLWRYDPTSDEWEEMPPLPAEGRSGASCFRIGDTAFVIGGRTANKDALKEVWAYDIQSGQWIEKSSLPFQGIWNASAASVKGKGYLLFGKDRSGHYKRGLYAYHPGRDDWEKIGSFPGRGRTYSHLWSYQGDLYTMGGMDSTGRVHGDLWRYEPEEGRWEEMIAPPTDGRRGGMGFRGGYSLYYSTGLDTALERSKKSYKLHLPAKKDFPSLRLRPNPTPDKVFIIFDQPSLKGEERIELIDRRGRIVMEQKIHCCHYELDLKGVSPGLYILRIVGGDTPIQKKLIKTDR